MIFDLLISFQLGLFNLRAMDWWIFGQPVSMDLLNSVKQFIWKNYNIT